MPRPSIYPFHLRRFFVPLQHHASLWALQNSLGKCARSRGVQITTRQRPRRGGVLVERVS